MKKQASASATKDHKNAATTNTASKSKSGKSTQTVSRSNDSATSKVKPKVGHGMANEGTNVNYEGNDN